MNDARQLYLGDVRALLDHDFWASEAGRTFFRVIADETSSDVLTCLYSLASALQSGDDDNAVVAAPGQPGGTVTAPAYAVADLSMTALCRAAAAARDVQRALTPQLTGDRVRKNSDMPPGWVDGNGAEAARHGDR